MKYMGGKYFLGKELSEIMKQYVKPEEVTGYVEPFCGALSVLMHMNNEYTCNASDNHPDLIQLWTEVQDGSFKPPTQMNEKIYLECKDLKSPNALKGFVGFGLSFGGKFFSGYADKYRNNKNENFLQEALNSLEKIKPKLKGVKFKCISYDKLRPSKKLIYCDPPYQKTKHPIKYRRDVKHYDEFDNERFWDVMRKWSKDNYVFISETSAPDDFIPVWEKKSHRSASQSDKTRYKNKSESYQIEKLYIHKDLK